MATRNPKLPPALAALAFDLAVFDQSSLFWDADGRAFIAFTSTMFQANRHHIPGAGYQMIGMAGPAGCGRTSAVRAMVGSIRGSVDYLEIDADMFTEAVVTAAEAYLPGSTRQTVILLSGIGAALTESIPCRLRFRCETW